MVNINNVFQSNYLKAADLEDKPHLCTIVDVSLVAMNDGEQKLCVMFKEWERGLLLNKTNAHNISEFCGPETDGWRGRQVVLQTALVDFQGKTVEAIRVRKPKTTVQPMKAVPLSDGPPKGHPAAGDFIDDPVPF